MRLIDVDALGVGRCSKDILPAAYCAGWNGLLNMLQAAPTVDAKPIVHCKDCVHSGTTELGRRYCKKPLGMYASMPVNDDDFCSYGCRKECKTDG